MVNRFVFISIPMNFDPFTQEPIHHGGIWDSSNCLANEDAAVNFFTDKLTELGYTSQDSRNRIWQRGNKKVIVCLVDDIRSCSTDYHADLPYLFDRDTTVITDNYIGCPTQYRVWNIPPSFFNIYTNTPNAEWTPDRNYTFSVNRIDQRRLKLMLELGWRVHMNKGYVNFNCQKDFDGDTFKGTERLPANFDHFWNELSDEDQTKWTASYKLLQPQMPLKNYDCSHEEIHSRSWLNIVVESYSSDNSAAFSEKMFRALTLPVPWTCYTGRYGIAYLESLGFDCLSDIIDHNHYDRLKEVENKIGIFVWKSLEVIKHLKNQDFAQLKLRCEQAATYNRELLKMYQHHWPAEFDHWKAAFLPHLA